MDTSVLYLYIERIFYNNITYYIYVCMYTHREIHIHTQPFSLFPDSSFSWGMG